MTVSTYRWNNLLIKEFYLADQNIDIKMFGKSNFIWGMIDKDSRTKQPNDLNATFLFYPKIILHHHHPSPPTTTHRNPISAISHLLLTWLWSNLKGRFLEYLEQIQTETVTFVQATFVLATFVHNRNVSAVTDLILTKLKDRILGPSLTNANPHVDICPINISQQHLSISVISQTFWTQFYGILNCLGTHFFWPTYFLKQQFFVPYLF